jgi:hypothetical protein
MTEATDRTEPAAETAEPAPVAMGSPAKDLQVDYYEPPWREARGRISAAWRRGGTGRRVGLALAAALAAALLGAFVFGLIHVVVGGLVKGNWKAGGFGIALSSVTGVLLWIEAAAVLRLLPPASR